MFLVHIFIRVILPVCIVLAIGYVYARRFQVTDYRPFTRIVWNVTGPCLAFAALAVTTIPDDDFIRIVAFVLITAFIMWPLTIIAAKALRLDRKTSSAFQLSVLLGNIVNYGFPVLLFAFGANGVERGVVFMAGNQVILATVAVFIASRGSASLRQSLSNITRVPLLYASILGFAVNRLGIAVPQPIFEPINLIGQMNLMLMLLILGMQLSTVKITDGRRAIATAVALRLVAATVIGALVADVLGMQGLTRQAVIIESGTPTAVYAAIIATEYDAAPGFASAVIFVSTLASIATMTVALALLGVR